MNAAALPADLAGLTFTPGLYRQVSAVALSTGTCTLDAQGDANAVFIFQIGTVLGLAAGTEITLGGGARATNVYWAVGASATLGAGSKLKGTILATTAITMGAGAAVEGRLLAHGASIRWTPMPSRCPRLSSARLPRSPLIRERGLRSAVYFTT